jgi:2-dehydro-3-deoxyphosphogluconate aldolase / (4S)-4-hydroxy-2-oxoglutarate aldolase
MSALVDVACTIEQERLMAIIRIDGAAEAASAARALVAGGIRVLEFSLAADGALDALEESRDLDAVVGAGTVLDAGQAQVAVERGAQYLVAPGLDGDVLRWATDADVLHIPGAFSPSEVLAADRAGAPLIKLFPAGRVGPRYVADLLGPVRHLRLIPTGGIDEGNVVQFLEAGATAVGLGSALVRAGRSEEETTERARRLTGLVAELRRDE